MKRFLQSLASLFTVSPKEGEKKLVLSKKSSRLLLKEILLLFLFTAILLFCEYAESILGRAYIYAAPIVWWLYTGAILLLFLLTVIFNRGIDTKVPAEEDLLPTMTAEEKRIYIEKWKKGKRIARILLQWLLPILGAWLIDLLYLYLL